MSRVYLKLLLALVMLALLITTILAAVRGVSHLIAYFKRGANPAAALNIVPNVPPELDVDLRWLPDGPNVGRVPSPWERREMESSYVRAWLQLNFSRQRDEPYGLKTYFTGPAHANVLADLESSRRSGLRITTTDSAHELRLNFLSEDGSIASLTDHGALHSFIVEDMDRRAVASGEVLAEYDVVMILDDGNWRIRHVKRTRVRSLDAAGPTPRAGFIGVSRGRLSIGEREYRVRGVAYHAGGRSRVSIWTLSDAELQHDLDLIKRLRFDTLRVVLPFEAFGRSRVSPQALARMDRVLMLARERELKVLVTLFDGHDEHEPLHWNRSDRHLQAILQRFSHEPTVLAWDLKAEPEHGSDTAVTRAWLAHTARLARLYAPNHLITVSTTDPELAAYVGQFVDFISLHDWGSVPSAVDAKLAQVSEAWPQKPILVSAFGLDSANEWWFPGHTEVEQARYAVEVRRLAEERHHAGTVVWSLYDNGALPGFLQRVAWKRAAARRMGIVRPDGTLAPAATDLASPVITDRQASVASLVFKPFHFSVSALFLVTCLGGWGLQRRRKRRLRGGVTPR